MTASPTFAFDLRDDVTDSYVLPRMNMIFKLFKCHKNVSTFQMDAYQSMGGLSWETPF